MTSSVVAEEWTRGETVGEDVVSAVADATDTAPLSLEPLYDAIDPETATALFERDRGEFDGSRERIEFAYAGCDVVVTADGAVSVSDSGRETETAESRR